MKLRTLTYATATCLLLATGCIKDELDPTTDSGINGTSDPDQVTAMANLNIPDGFEFSTERKVSLEISDPENGVRYTLMLNGKEVYNGLVVNGKINGSISLPYSEDEVTLLRRTAIGMQELTKVVSNDQIIHNN